MHGAEFRSTESLIRFLMSRFNIKKLRKICFLLNYDLRFRTLSLSDKTVKRVQRKPLVLFISEIKPFADGLEQEPCRIK